MQIADDSQNRIFVYLERLRINICYIWKLNWRSIIFNFNNVVTNRKKGTEHNSIIFLQLKDFPGGAGHWKLISVPDTTQTY